MSSAATLGHLLSEEEPWCRSELRQVVALTAVGAVALALGWWNVREADSFDQQRGWLVESIVALAFVGVVLARWLATVMRRTKVVQRALTVSIADGLWSTSEPRPPRGSGIGERLR